MGSAPQTDHVADKRRLSPSNRTASRLRPARAPHPAPHFRLHTPICLQVSYCAALISPGPDRKINHSTPYDAMGPVSPDVTCNSSLETWHVGPLRAVTP